MKILTFLHSFEPGGVERVALRLAACWQKQGLDAPVFMGRADGAGRIAEAKRLRLIYPAKPAISPALIETIWMIATLPRAIRREQPDVLFCAGNSYSVVAVAMKLLLGNDCPPIVAKISNDLERRDLPLPARWLYHIWLRIQAMFLDQVVAMEASMKPEIARCMGISDDRTMIIPDPAISQADIHRLARLRKNNVKEVAGRRFVAVGRLTRQKNIAMMLRAFAKGSVSGDTLVIVGDGSLRKSLEAQSRSLGLAECVHFAGHVDDIAPWLAKSDFYLMSSNYEGVPAVIIEALATGLPIITTNCSNAISAMLDGGRLGRIVAAGDEKDMARAIKFSAPDFHLIAGRIDMAGQFTLENSGRLYAGLFAALTDRRRKEQGFLQIRSLKP
ncbi:glycosyltransferase [Parasphingorhabdus sp.]|uniref:glycosyltransferase n=1 Tax=Parasphingorhabdus sp. TaxID=2709688 RepID=UPI003003471A